jgi:DNA polymerase elongation subunit (family B)
MSKSVRRPSKRKNDGPVKPCASIAAFFNKKHISEQITSEKFTNEKSNDSIVAQWATNVHTKLSEHSTQAGAEKATPVPAMERQSSVIENEKTVQMVDVSLDVSQTSMNRTISAQTPPNNTSVDADVHHTVSACTPSSTCAATTTTITRATSTSSSAAAASGTLSSCLLQSQNSSAVPPPARSTSTQSWTSSAGTAMTKADEQKHKAEMKKKQNEDNKEQMKKDKRDEHEHKNDEWEEFVSMSNRDTIFNEPATGTIPYTWLCPPWPDATTTNENDMELYVNDIDLKMLPSFLFTPALIQSQPTIYKRPKYRVSDRIEDDTMGIEEDLSDVTYQVFVPRIFAVASNGCPTVVRVHGYFEEVCVLVPPALASQILRSTFNSNETFVVYHHEQKRIPCLSLPGFSDEEMVLKKWDDETAFERTRNQADIRRQRDDRLHHSFFAQETCKSLHRVLEEHLQRNPEHRGKVGNGKFALVRSVDMVLRQNCKGYDNNQQLLMFRIQYSFPELRRDIMSVISRDTGVIISGNVYFIKYNDFFDADIPSLINFMANLNLAGSVWLTLPKFKYTMKKNQLPIESSPAERSRIRWQDENVSFQIPPEHLCTPDTYLDGEDKIGAAYSGEREQSYRTWYRREFDIRFSDIISHRGKTEAKYTVVPPLRNLIFDLETYWDGKNKKVDPMKPANCIYSASWVVDGVTSNADDVLTAVSLWQPPDRLFAHDLTALHYEPGKNASVWVFDSERAFLIDMLDRIRNGGFSRFAGHHIEKFDIPVFLLRCFYYKIYNAVYLSPAKEPASLKYTFFESRGRGQRDNVQSKIPGINIFDTLVWALNEEKYDSNTLGAISEIVLDCTKDEVPYSIMQDLFQGTLQQLLRFLRYNLKDSLLVKGIIRTKNLLTAFYPQIEAVNGVTLSILMYDGISVRSESQFIFWKNKFGMVFPKAPKSTAKVEADAYVGGAVEEPKKGLHDLVLTGDFASLYPSVIMALNLCMSTLINSAEELQRIHPSRYRKLVIPSWYSEEYKKQMPERVHYFIKMHVRRGLLAVQVLQPYKIRNILKDLIAAAVAYSPLYYTLEANSKALKLAANGAYGWIAQGKRKCIAVPESVTFFGRCCIKKSSQIVLTYFCPTNPKWNRAQAERMLVIAGVSQCVVSSSFFFSSTLDCSRMSLLQSLSVRLFFCVCLFHPAMATQTRSW